MPNMGKNARAKSIGVLNRMDPPHKERSRQVRMMTDGMEIIMVVVWKKLLMSVPMLVKYI